VRGYSTIINHTIQNYETETDYLRKHYNCAWVFSERASVPVLGKYDNCAECAWNLLYDSAWHVLEQYDNWEMVLQGVVAFNAALGEFHPANE